MLVDKGTEVLSSDERIFLKSRGLQTNFASKLHDDEEIEDFLNVSDRVWRIKNETIETPYKQKKCYRCGSKDHLVNNCPDAYVGVATQISQSSSSPKNFQ